MKTVLITGPIGSGKSLASMYLSSKGWPVYDCDSRCKALYDEVPGLRERIEEELGIAFSELSLIFTDDALREKLESLVYPILIEDFESWKAAQDSPVVFVESALAMSKPAFDRLYDEVLLIDAPADIRYRRHPGAELRDALQTFDRNKVNHIIVNDSDPESLYAKIDIYENESC